MISPMRLKLLASFLTLVLALSVSAAPDTQVYPAPIDKLKTKAPQKSQTSGSENTVDLESMQLAPPPPVDGGVVAPRLVGTMPAETLNFAPAFASGNFEKTHKRLEGGIVSVGKTIFQDEKTAWDLSAGLFLPEGDTLLALEGGVKIIVEDWIPYEPYYKLALSAFYEPKDQIGNVIDYRKYFVGGFAGFENLFGARRQYKVELGVQVGYAGTHVLGRFVYGLP